MAQCPHCQASLPEDFGLIECASCGAQVFLEMDGHKSSEEELLRRVDSIIQGEHSGNIMIDTEAEHKTTVVENAENGGGVEPSLATAPDMADVAQFANSAVSAGHDGALYYRVFVEGIDTQEIKQNLKDILADRKFLWDAEALLRQVKLGILVLDHVTPVKTSLLVQRLQDLPLNVRWEQHALSEP